MSPYFCIPLLHGFSTLQYFFAQKCAPHCCELKSSAQLLFDNPFSLLLLGHQPFAKSIPIISARELNAPVTYHLNNQPI